MTKPKDTEAYVAAFPEATRMRLRQVRATIKKAAPQVEEVVSYGMPGYKLNGMLVWFAGYARHIGFYPGSSGIASFKKELSEYKSAKGSVQFPLDKPLPLGLIARIVKFRVKENAKPSKAKRPRKLSAPRRGDTRA
jgi:uncharacterized protein YdhG (YjbR/CyaY superfamily)